MDNNIVTCQQCKGKGFYFTKLPQSKSTPWRFARNDNLPVEHCVPCDVAGCHNGKVNLEEQHRILWGN